MSFLSKKPVAADPEPVPAAIATSTPEPQPLDTRSTEERLFDAMDRGVEALIAKIEDESIDPRDKIVLLRLGMEWAVKSKKLRPKKEEGGSVGIDVMREAIAGLLPDLLAKRGVVLVDEKRHRGRPSNAEKAARQAQSHALNGGAPEDAKLKEALGVTE